VFSAKTPQEKLAQRQFFFWYKPEERRGIEQSLRRIGRPDLIAKLYAGMAPQGVYRPSGNGKPKSYNPNFNNDHSRAKHHSEEPQEEKRGRHRRHR
jgi:hypothetical protein